MAVATTLVAAACSTAPGPAPVREQMQTHFDLALDLRAAALVGDLHAVRRAAAGLADLQRPRDLSREHRSQLGPLARVARDAERAETVSDAAHETARVAQACADCHVANGVRLEGRLAAGPAGTAAGVRGHMSELRRASDALWNGAAGPSDALWRAGAKAIATAGPLPTGLARSLSATYVYDAGLRLRRLGTEASAAQGPEERIRVLGDVWATCAGCHTRAEVG